ncbi:hypothetical protein AALP_AA3G080100 [Arabis alpina]|uniref:Probable purine permease n=1 Tax=Arabis alpina TaxID=50452 RepID=A0A087H7T2_ARAAL|nr:hypothetical protein AALP_AA3G080100 [Arabis alpina]
MAKNHQPVQTKTQGVQLPINIEHDSTTLINQTENSNRKPNHWPTIILCVIFVITGQSIAKLLEHFHYDQIHHIENRQNDGVWTQSLLQTVGFPLLLFPLFIFKKHNQQQPPITSDLSSTRYIISLSGCIGSLLAGQGRFFSKAKLTLIYTTQLFSTLIFAFFINKIKFNRWIIISLIFAAATGALTFSSSFGGEENYTKGASSALFSGVYFSLLLCIFQSLFKRNESNVQNPSFASVFEVLIFSSLFATILSVVGLLIYGEQEDLKREMDGFSKGKGVYVMAMVGQAVSWQVYWVGIVGLVFSVSSVLSNVISVITWPIVSVLVVIFFNAMDDEFDVFKDVALITAVLSVAAYFFRLHKENRDSVVIAN